MFQTIKRSLIAVLVLGALALPATVCATAYARIFPSPQSPAVSAQKISANIPQSRGLESPSNGFDWADAGIGAAAALALVGAGNAMVTSRRRQGRHTATT
jgi:hypothetical protein